MMQPAETHAFHEKRMSCALIIGVFNEGGKFMRQLAALQPYRHLVDILIADGGSTDGATSIAQVQGQARLLLINREAARGLSVQYRQALRAALSDGYDAIIMMDGNGKDGVEAIPRFIEALESGVDFVQGSRFLRGGEHRNTPLDRVLGIRFVFNPLMRLASGYAYTDAMNGFKACTRRFLTDQRVQPLRPVFVRYSLQYYLNYIAPRLGFRVVEIPVARSYPNDGTPYSKIKGLRARVKILGELLATISGRFNVR